jgi:GNAT superfamily N-acetyltransferase
MGKGNDPNCASAAMVAMPPPDSEPARPRVRGRTHPQEPTFAHYETQLAAPLAAPQPRPERQRFHDAHNFSFAGLTVSADHERHPYEINEATYHGVIRDSAGQRVGYIERHLSHGPDNRLITNNGRFRLDPEQQGRGFGRAYSEHLADRYRDLGVARHAMSAIEHGVYAWAGVDVIFDPYHLPYQYRESETDLRWAGAFMAAELWRQYEGRLSWSVRDGVISSEQYTRFARQFARPRDLAHPTVWRNRLLTPHQIAQYGRDEPFEDQDGQLTWIGKHFLLGRTSDLLTDGNRGRGLVWSGLRLLDI